MILNFAKSHTYCQTAKINIQRVLYYRLLIMPVISLKEFKGILSLPKIFWNQTLRMWYQCVQQQLRNGAQKW